MGFDHMIIMGPLTGGPQCRLAMSPVSNLLSMSHVKFKKWPMSCHVTHIFSHVDRLHVAFQPVEFNGPRPLKSTGALPP